jgi:hypothetical protein
MTDSLNTATDTIDTATQAALAPHEEHLGDRAPENEILDVGTTLTGEGSAPATHLPKCFVYAPRGPASEAAAPAETGEGEETQAPRQQRRHGNAPASSQKLSALLSIGVGGAARTKHSAHSANPDAMAALKNIGVTKQRKDEELIVVSYEHTTKLGLFLERTAKAPFTYPNLGQWQSVAALKSYLESSYVDDAGNVHFDDTWRLIHSYECKRKWNQFKDAGYRARRIDGLKTIIADATYQKILQNQEYMLLMVESKGVFVNTTGEDHTRDWYMLALEEIRAAFKERARIAVQVQELQIKAAELSGKADATEEDQAMVIEINEREIPNLISEIEAVVPNFSELDSVYKTPQERRGNNRRNDRGNTRR